MAIDNSLLEIYIYENMQLLEQLDAQLLVADKSDWFTEDQVAAIFRVLHTIKGSSAMMEFDKLAGISHALEDLFGYIRDHMDDAFDHRKICDITFAAEDFIRAEIEKLEAGNLPDGDASELLEATRAYYNELTGVEQAMDKPAAVAAAPMQVDGAPFGGKGFYKAVVHFEKQCQMENVRAFGIIRSIENICKRIITVPEDVLQDQSDDYIVEHGFTMFIESDADPAEIRSNIEGNILIDNLVFEEMPSIAATPLDRRLPRQEAPPVETQDTTQTAPAAQKYSYMSVRLDKLDKLMDLVGEIVTTEMTVTKNPDIIGLQLENFSKAARSLRKLTDELQDTVMSIRMIPISATFHKMERIVRDMCKKTNKDVDLVIIGEDTEMDKNVIDNLSDPLMHIIRNSMDHGIELPEIREQMGKPRKGTITVEARNTGGDVLILASDDGKGLDREVLIKKGLEKGLVKKPPEELTDREAYGLIFAPGFSTKENVTEFSGRGVGMDVVTKNIQKMGGSIAVDSTKGGGMAVTMRIPLTLAIIDGMQVQVGKSVFIIPLLSIRESFKPKENDVFTDPQGNEMILIREECYSVVRLHSILKIDTEITRDEDGILILLESDNSAYCLFVDCLIGEQQTVIKPMPAFVSRNVNWLKGIAGCTILGDGNISLILDINTLR